MITSHPDVDGITFTGETVTGSIILKAVAPTLKASSMEMGGKNAGIVFEDRTSTWPSRNWAGRASSTAARSASVPSGSTCTNRSSTRSPTGWWTTPRPSSSTATRTTSATNFGPVVSDEHRDKVLSYYKLAEEEGAEVLHGGGAPKFGDERDGGSWVEPTIWKGLAHDSRVATEEIFGPAVALIPTSPTRTR